MQLQETLTKNNLIKAFKVELRSAIGIVFDKKGNVLLGRSTSDDERSKKWVFPGGGIDKGESPLQAAIREVYEEAGVSATPLHITTIIHPSKPKISFIALTCDSEKCTIKWNDEFDDMKWFPLLQLPQDTLSINVEVLKMLNSYVR